MSINWIKVSEEVLSGGITLLVSFATLLIHNLITTRHNKCREQILYELATLRGKGVELRNYGEDRQLVGAVLSNWIKEAKQLENEMVKKATELSKVEAKRLEYLDRVPALVYGHIMDADQVKALQNLSGLLHKCDAVLAKYRF